MSILIQIISPKKEKHNIHLQICRTPQDLAGTLRTLPSPCIWALSRSIHATTSFDAAALSSLIAVASLSRATRIIVSVGNTEPEIRQRGYVYQKGRKQSDPWLPTQRAYGFFRKDVPGQSTKVEVRPALGFCRDRMGAMLRLHQAMEEAGVLDVEKIRERITPVTTFESQAAWWLAEIKAGRIVNKKTRKLIRPRTIDAYSTAVGYLKWHGPRKAPRLARQSRSERTGRPDESRDRGQGAAILRQAHLQLLQGVHPSHRFGERRQSEASLSSGVGFGIYRPANGLPAGTAPSDLGAGRSRVHSLQVQAFHSPDGRRSSGRNGNPNQRTARARNREAHLRGLLDNQYPPATRQVRRHRINPENRRRFPG